MGVECGLVTNPDMSKEVQNPCAQAKIYIDQFLNNFVRDGSVKHRSVHFVCVGQDSVGPILMASSVLLFGWYTN